MPALRTHDGPYTIHSYAASFGLDYWLLPVDGASHRDDGPMQATTKLFVSVTLSHKLLSIPVMLRHKICLSQPQTVCFGHQHWPIAIIRVELIVCNSFQLYMCCLRLDFLRVQVPLQKLHAIIVQILRNTKSRN